ncbi:MAG: hypothetical protein ACRCYS_06405 [Beijerinckiaceae bacterium]
MTNSRPLGVDRRTVLAGLGAGTGLFAAGIPLRAQTPNLLTVSTRQIEVNKKAATVFGITGPN